MCVRFDIVWYGMIVMANVASYDLERSIVECSDKKWLIMFINIVHGQCGFKIAGSDKLHVSRQVWLCMALPEMDMYGQSTLKTVSCVVLWPGMTNCVYISPVIASSVQLWKEMSGFAIRGVMCWEWTTVSSNGLWRLKIITDDRLRPFIAKNYQFWSALLICVRFPILWHTVTKIVKRVLIWPVMDYYDQRCWRMIDYFREHRVWPMVSRYLHFWPTMLRNDHK
jgi:hypothetical protein